ncbi:hypothetical protein N784_07605 [Pontibacillus litoralis JSM 072002]|uniref:Pyridoxal phosphate homeostasis protein n=1 Tax=Pontibacillus litoralis JSM 072002 TaxID=1385512 RepID=A0A0A5G5Z5_9BACI|nr:hypothetical protein N784_07605 [Pontibacillus litoralis JSM 072002]
MVNVAQNADAIQQQINLACEQCRRSPADITTIAVTKYVSVERAQEALNIGIAHIGENRVEGFREKHDAVGNQANVHFIGTLQSRKVKEIIDDVAMIHSLDRMSLAKEIQKRATRKVACFVQVNVSGEQSKQGISPEEVVPFIEELRVYTNVEVVGLMTMAPAITDETQLRSIFSTLRAYKEEVERQGWEHAPCHYLSMGMSNDFRIAIEEGATHIRIGSKLVGKQFE